MCLGPPGSYQLEVSIYNSGNPGRDTYYAVVYSSTTVIGLKMSHNFLYLSNGERRENK